MFWFKNPAMYPITVLKRQLKPNGAPDKKSINIPEQNPIDSPKTFPFKTEKYKRTNKTISGTAGRIVIFDNIANSTRTVHNIIKIEERYALVIFIASLCH